MGVDENQQIVPPGITNDQQIAIHKMMDTESLVLTPAKTGRITFKEFEKTWSAFEKPRT